MAMTTELKKIANLAWPLLIAQVTQTLMGVSDTVMAGRYSATDMAAVAIGFSITMPILFFIQGIILALPPILSRLSGAGNTHLVANATQQCMWLAVALSLLVSLSVIGVDKAFAVIDMEAKLKQETIEYTSFILLGAPAFTLYQVLRNYCEGLSITKPTMLIMLIGLAVNIPANYIFIYGKFGAAEMGGAGCGIATMLVYIAMFLATVVYSKKSKKLDKYDLYKTLHRPNMKDIITTLRLGLPIAMTIVFEVTLFGVVALLLSPFGSLTVAAHQIALNFSSLMFMLPLSIGMACTIRVGYLLGQENSRQASMALKSAMLLGIIIAILSAILTLIARSQIAALYTKETEVIQLAANLMLLAAMFQFSDAIQVISAGALRGYKDTAAMFYLTFIAYWLIGLPIGCVLALTDWLVPAMSAAGFWVGFICGLTSAAILLGGRLFHIQQKYI